MNNLPEQFENSERPVQRSAFQKIQRAAALTSLLAATACGSTVEVVDSTSSGVGGSVNTGGSSGEGGSGGVGGMGGAGGNPEGFFTVSYLGNEGPTALVGQDGARCLNIEIENGLSYDVDMKDWNLMIAEEGPSVTQAGGLMDTTQNPTVANYTLIKLSRINDDNTIGGTIFGPSELFPGSDISQGLELNGQATVASGSKIRAAVVVDIANNQAIVGDKIRCTLQNFTNGFLFQSGTSTPVPEENVVPDADIPGNVIEITVPALPCVDVQTASMPAPQTLSPGATDVNFACWTFLNGCFADQRLNALSLRRYGVGMVEDFGSLRLYEGTTAISDFETLSPETESVIFNNIDYLIAKGQTKTFCVHGNVSPGAGGGNVNGFEISQSEDVVFQDQITSELTGGDGNFPVQGPQMTIAN